MEREVKNINSKLDVNISILQYISQRGISIETQINHIKSGEETDIVINQFFQTSQDYEALLDLIELKNKELATTESAKDKLDTVLQNELEHLVIAEHRFRIDALRLAETLLKINPRTERLRMAYQLYNEGKFLAVDEILNETDLLNDQEELFALMDYHENKQEQLFEMINEISTSFKGK